LKPYDPHEVPYKVKLNANENPYGLPEKIVEEILKEAKELNYSLYPNANSTELSQVVSSSFGLNMDNIVIGNGSDELIEYLIKAFQRKKEEELFLPCLLLLCIKYILPSTMLIFIQIPLAQEDFFLKCRKIIRGGKKRKLLH